jgi:hypothetical protein
MALIPYSGGGGGGLRGGGGGSSGCLHTLLEVVIVAVVVGALIQGGALENLARGLVSMSDHVVNAARIVVGGLAVMAMVGGGIMAISPFHRRLGYEVALGGLVAVVLAAFGPTIVHDVQNALPAQLAVPASASIMSSGEEPSRL